MWSLILVITFTPFLWGESSTRSLEISGFNTQTGCQQESEKFTSYKDNSGTTMFYKKCIYKGETK